MRLSTMVRLAWAGRRTDWLRLVFTAMGAALATIVLLSSATVMWLPPTELIQHMPGGGTAIYAVDHRYVSSLLNETDRRPWLAAMLLLLTLPALAFAGQSARLGAPARDRRLSAIRLAGATAGQATLLGIAEAVIACLGGTVLGIGGFFILHQALDRPVLVDPFAEEFGESSGNLVPRLPFPTDTLPPSWVFTAVLVLVPVVAAVFAALALRRVTVTPLAVSRRTRIRRLRWWPLVAIVLGFGILAVHQFLNRNEIGEPDIVLPLTAWSAVLLLTVGVALGVGVRSLRPRKVAGG